VGFELYFWPSRTYPLVPHFSLSNPLSLPPVFQNGLVTAGRLGLGRKEGRYLDIPVDRQVSSFDELCSTYRILWGDVAATLHLNRSFLCGLSEIRNKMLSLNLL